MMLRLSWMRPVSGRGVAAFALLLGMACGPSTPPQEPARPRPVVAMPKPTPAPLPAPPPPEPEPLPPPKPTVVLGLVRQPGEPCTQGKQCITRVCEGTGCGEDQGVCAQPARLCTRDAVPFCGCDGQTFQASSTCPGKTFRKRAPCP